MRILAFVAVLGLVACAGASSVKSAGALRAGSVVPRAPRSVGPSLTFRSSPVMSATCYTDELTFVYGGTAYRQGGTIHVPSGGSVVVDLASCNTTSGDRMAAYISNNPFTCNYATDSQLGNNGDGGSASARTNVAIIAGSVPCTGSYVEITDLVTNAVGDMTIAVP